MNHAGMSEFLHGPNRDVEGKSAPFSHGFVATFHDRAAHAAYADHLEHQRAAQLLIEKC